MAGGPSVVGEILAIPLADIDVGERLRPIDPVWASALGGIMAVEGQRTPIEVCRLPGSSNFRLVSGGHRFDGARRIGWTHIHAVIVDNDALGRRAREVSENLWRKGLDPVDRAAFVVELYAIQKARSGLGADEGAQSVAAQVRWQRVLKDQAHDANVTVTLAYGWADNVADQIGLSRKTIYRDLALHRALAPDVIARLRGHPVMASAGQMRALGNATPGDQRTVADLILSGAAKTVGEALATLTQKPRASAESKAWSAFFGGWSRMSAAKRREALGELSNQGLPKGCRLTITQGE